MRVIRFSVALVMIWSLAACGGLQSQSATLYEFDNKQWLVMTDSTVQPGTGIFSVSTARQVALRMPDGSFREVALSGDWGDRDGGDGSTVVEINPAIQQAYVKKSDDPVGDLISRISRNGMVVSELNPRAITEEDGSFRFPDSARRKPKTEREEGMGY